MVASSTPMPAPAETSVDLLDWIVSRHVHEYLDDAGRPIGEGRANAFRRVETEMQSCPYSGSRYNHAKAMNVSALRQMPPWRDILTMLSWLSQRYRAAHGCRVATANDLAQVTSAGLFLVDFLALRRQGALRSGEMPKLFSGLYKVCLGFQLAYLPERFAEQDRTILPDADGFYDYLETTELLIGEAEVCSGTPAMITQAYDVIVGEATVSEAALPAPCARLAIDWDRFDRFTRHAGDLWLDLVRYIMRSSEFCPILRDPRIPPTARQRLNERLAQYVGELAQAQSGLLVEIAQASRAYSGGPAPISRSEPEAPCFRTTGSTIAPTVLTWLVETASEDMRELAPVVAEDLETQLLAYEREEAALLAGLDRHLGALMQALGRDASGSALTPEALTRLCGRTLRDWTPDPTGRT